MTHSLALRAEMVRKRWRGEPKAIKIELQRQVLHSNPHPLANS
jgi:hypothetical protein